MLILHYKVLQCLLGQLIENLNNICSACQGGRQGDLLPSVFLSAFIINQRMLSYSKVQKAKNCTCLQNTKPIWSCNIS